MKIREAGADERWKESDYWLGSLTWCVRCGVLSVGLMETDNYTFQSFEDVNSQAHKSLGFDIYIDGGINFSFHIIFWTVCCKTYTNTGEGHAVAPLDEVLRYEPESRGFVSLYCHWTQSLTEMGTWRVKATGV